MANTSGRHRRKFTPEYRREAAHLVIDTGRMIAEVARDIGVGAQLLGRWVAQERAATPGREALGESERAELERLRAENQPLRMDNDFLSRAASFFAPGQPGRTVSR
jgi:transposase